MKSKIILILIGLTISGCSIISKKKHTTKKEVEYQTKVESVYFNQTHYIDTGKIVTITKVEYEYVYDTILKKIIVYPKTAISKTSENKAIRDSKSENGAVTKEKDFKQTESEKIAEKEKKSFNIIPLIIILILIALFIFRKHLFFWK